jgi:hypothetical protein
MYQIVATSDFIRDLKEMTSGSKAEAAPTAFEELVAPRVPAAPAGRAGFGSIASAVLCAAHRLLGAH